MSDTEPRTFGWRPAPPDFRHHKFADFNPIVAQAALPASVDLRSLCPHVYDQGSLGSCTSQSAAALFAVILKKMNKPQYTPSRLFIYYNERVLEGTVGHDSGASIVSSMKAMAKWGCPNESLWWYNIKKYKTKPNQKVYDAGLKDRIKSYQLLNNTKLDELKTCLAEGYPFTFGFSVFSSFMDIRADGLMPMPSRKEDPLGGHAVLAVGYDDAKRMVLVRNSWGTDWGLGGYFWMPYEFITSYDFCDEFWTARTVNFMLSAA